MRRTVVGDVQGSLVGREGQAVGLVEAEGDTRGLPRGGVVAIDVIADGGRGPKALQVAVAGIGEPHRAVARDDHVVGRVQRPAAPVVGHGLCRAAAAVHRADARGLVEGALLAHDQPPVGADRHPVGHVGVGAHDGDLARGEVEAFDVDARRVARDRLRREVQGVLVGGVDRALVGVGGRDDLHPRRPDRLAPPARALRAELSADAVHQGCRGQRLHRATGVGPMRDGPRLCRPRPSPGRCLRAGRWRCLRGSGGRRRWPAPRPARRRRRAAPARSRGR